MQDEGNPRKLIKAYVSLTNRGKKKLGNRVLAAKIRSKWKHENHSSSSMFKVEPGRPWTPPSWPVGGNYSVGDLREGRREIVPQFCTQ